MDFDAHLNDTMAQSLPSPPVSSAPSLHPSLLPQPRKHALKAGGSKESELIRYLDSAMNRIQKRVDNRGLKRSGKTVDGGYTALREVAQDLDGLIDIIWVSGSPNLQVPYLLRLAGLIGEYVPLFPFSTRSAQSTFNLLSKLDSAFSSLLTGTDATTSEPLPGFESGRRVSTTDQVRIRSIVKRTRLIIVRAMSKDSEASASSDSDEAMDVDSADDEIQWTDQRRETIAFEGFEDNEVAEEWEERSAGAVYEKTINELGDVLGGESIGIVTDD